MCAAQVDPALKFYTSLREQKPDSEMDKKWYALPRSSLKANSYLGNLQAATCTLLQLPCLWTLASAHAPAFWQGTLNAFQR